MKNFREIGNFKLPMNPSAPPSKDEKYESLRNSYSSLKDDYKTLLRNNTELGKIFTCDLIIHFFIILYPLLFYRGHQKSNQVLKLDMKDNEIKRLKTENISLQTGLNLIRFKRGENSRSRGHTRGHSLGNLGSNLSNLRLN